MDQSTVMSQNKMLGKIRHHVEEHGSGTVDVIPDDTDPLEWDVLFKHSNDGAVVENWRYTSSDQQFHLVENDEFINHKEKLMSDSSYVRKRVTIDLLVDPGTASPRAMAALANEAKEYTEVVLVKDREIRLVELGEVIDVHDHTSTPDTACHDCVTKLAMDERR